MLRGAERSLARHRPSLILEIAEGNFAAAGYETEGSPVGFLADHHYALALIGSGGQLSKVDAGTTKDFPEYCNVLCTPA